MKRYFHRFWHSPTFTSWASLLVRFASVVILLPVVLVRFSPEEVAVWQLFSALFVLSLLLDYGLAPNFSRLLSYARAGRALEDMARVSGQSEVGSASPAAARDRVLAGQAVFATMRWLYPRLALVVFLLLGVFGTWSLVKPIGQLPLPQSAWIAWALVLATMLIAVAGGCYGAALQGMNHIAPMRRWDIAFGSAQVASSVLVLSLGGGLLALVATYQVWAVLSVLRNRALLKSLNGELFDSPATKHSQVIRAGGQSTWRTLVSVLSSHGVIQLSGVFYGQAIPATELASYLLALRLITVVSQFSQAPFYTKLPQLTALHAAGQKSEVLVMAGRGMRIAHWVFLAGALAAAFGAPLFLTQLHSKTSFATPMVFAVMALAFFVERFGAMHMQVYTLTNHVVAHIGYGFTGLLVCAGTVLLLPTMGLLAFPLAMLTGYMLFFAPFALHYSGKLLKGTRWRFERINSIIPISLLLLGLAASVFLGAAPWPG